MSREVLLTVGALLGSVCLVLALLGAFYDVKPLVFRSGSMAPTIPAGGLALAKPVDAADLKVGDIVSVKAEGTRITHRVIAVQLRGDTAFLTLKGDANKIHDADRYRVKSADRVFVHLPYAGYVVAYVSGPVGLIATGMLCALLLWIVFRPSGRTKAGHGGRRRGPDGHDDDPGRHLRRTGAVVVLIGIASAAGSLTPVPTWASFSDSGTLGSGTLAAHSVVRPDGVACSVSGSTGTFSWSEKDPRYDYEIVLWRDDTTDSIVSTKQVTGGALSQAYSGLNDFGLGAIQVLGSYFYYAQVRSWVAGTTAPNRWQSPTVQQSTQHLRVNVTCVIVCILSSVTCV